MYLTPFQPGHTGSGVLGQGCASVNVRNDRAVAAIVIDPLILVRWGFTKPGGLWGRVPKRRNGKIRYALKGEIETFKSTHFHFRARGEWCTTAGVNLGNLIIMEMKVPKRPTRCNEFKRYVVQNPDTIASVPSSLTLCDRRSHVGNLCELESHRAPRSKQQSLASWSQLFQPYSRVQKERGE